MSVGNDLIDQYGRERTTAFFKLFLAVLFGSSALYLLSHYVNDGVFVAVFFLGLALFFFGVGAVDKTFRRRTSRKLLAVFTKKMESVSFSEKCQPNLFLTDLSVLDGYKSAEAHYQLETLQTGIKAVLKEVDMIPEGIEYEKRLTVRHFTLATEDEIQFSIIRKSQKGFPGPRNLFWSKAQELTWAEFKIGNATFLYRGECKFNHSEYTEVILNTFSSKSGFFALEKTGSEINIIEEVFTSDFDIGGLQYSRADVVTRLDKALKNLTLPSMYAKAVFEAEKVRLQTTKI